MTLFYRGNSSSVVEGKTKTSTSAGLSSEQVLSDDSGRTRTCDSLISEIDS